MFEKKAPMFLYCVSPVHMGAGTALGAIDNPIQRERHTEFPMMAGSGIKGALRHEWTSREGRDGVVKQLFGPKPDDGPKADASDHAGCVSFADAQLVAFPVRSLRRSFVYATCPTALARLKRLLVLGGVAEAGEWEIPGVEDDDCALLEGSKVVSGDDGSKVVLEAYEFKSRPMPKLVDIVAWLAEHALPGGDGFAEFRAKLEADLVVLSDERFGYFVRHSTVVEPHVRIDDATGTADDGGLFYTENLPPESILVSLVMCSEERKKKGDGAEPMPAQEVLQTITTAGPRRDGALVQIGGDATTGRGQVVLSFVGVSDD